MENLTPQEQIDSLKAQVKALSDVFYTNNFTAHQDFNKSCAFNTKLKVPSYSPLPSVCEIGEIVESGGGLYICSSNNSWELVGSQT